MKLAILLVLAMLPACKGSEPKPDPKSRVAVASAAKAPLEVVEVVKPLDSAPRRPFIEDEPRRLEPVLGRSKVSPPASLTVARLTAETAQGALYAVTDLDAVDPTLVAFGVQGMGADRLDCRVGGKRPAFAVLFTENFSGPPKLALRFAGETPVAAGLSVTCDRAAVVPVREPTDQGATLILKLPAIAGEAGKTLLPKVHAAIADHLDARASPSFGGQRGGRDAVLSFAAHRLRAVGTDGSDDLQQGRVGRSDLADLMALYTGLTSVEEALQTDRALRLRAVSAASTGAVSLASLKGVSLPAHPWAQMLSELPGKAKPIVEPLAYAVPADILYLHFVDLRSLSALARDVEEWLTPFVHAVEGAPGAYDVSTRYEQQLIVQRTGLSETFGHLAAKGVALVAGDPLLREGTDVSLLFENPNLALIEPTLEGFVAQARKRRPDLAVSTTSVAGVEVRITSTADGELSQHRAIVGGRLILSNSAAAMARFIQVAAGELPSLASQGDFQYFRAVYPHGPHAAAAAGGEDGFVFMSDAFVGKVTGAAFKIMLARRTAARADLRALGSTALTHGLFEGGLPSDRTALSHSPFASALDLKHDDGRELSYDAQTGPRSAFGTLAHMVPVTDLLAAWKDRTVTRAESEAYEEFQTGYQQYWRAFIDPIGVRIKRRDGGWALDARMLPLIERTEYDELLEITGSQTIAAPAPDDGLLWQLAVARDSKMRRKIDQTGRAFGGRAELGLQWLGDWVRVGLLDRNAVWDANMALNKVRSIEFPERPNRDSILGRLPVFAEAHVADGLALAATLTAVRIFVEQAAAGMVEWGSDEPHAGIPIVQVTQGRAASAGPASPFTLRYAIANGVLILGLSRAALVSRIDAAISQARPETAAAADTTQVSLSYARRTADAPLARIFAGLLEELSAPAHFLARSTYEDLSRGFAEAPDFETAAGRRRALAFLGFVPQSPFGGSFSVDGQGRTVHDVVGTEVEVRVDQSPITRTELWAFLSALSTAHATLAFEGEGNHRGLHTTFTFTR
ncbi:MAG: hypothetical protein EXR76_10730 [Myxococcales bacterium]|nr:hypothetical protein [Myxococcales bacterium]